MRMNMAGMPKTVYDRMKLNGGIIAGPNHKLSNQRIRESMEESAEKPEEPEGNEPPNLRDAERMDSCATCTHYAAQNCQKYDTEVGPSEICDDFAKVGAVEPKDMDSETVGMDEEDD